MTRSHDYNPLLLVFKQWLYIMHPNKYYYLSIIIYPLLFIYYYLPAMIISYLILTIKIQ